MASPCMSNNTMEGNGQLVQWIPRYPYLMITFSRSNVERIRPFLKVSNTSTSCGIDHGSETVTLFKVWRFVTSHLSLVFFTKKHETTIRPVCLGHSSALICLVLPFFVISPRVNSRSEYDIQAFGQLLIGWAPPVLTCSFINDIPKRSRFRNSNFFNALIE